mmetsp:Transcript_9140/g.23038  ORF Transcript_9140/g.23038 Transcript_9140/m.23038 type:complete len:117 (+) Transcript_9140:4327-4677(+)
MDSSRYHTSSRGTTTRPPGKVVVFLMSLQYRALPVSAIWAPCRLIEAVGQQACSASKSTNSAAVLACAAEASPDDGSIGLRCTGVGPAPERGIAAAPPCGRRILAQALLRDDSGRA